MASFAVSAPGKVILFGEHAVVYGVPAIAASVGLRTYLYAEPSKDPDVVELDFPDVGMIAQWTRHALPFVSTGNPTTVIDEDLRSQLLKDIETNHDTSFKKAAALAFLYLYVQLCESSTPGYRFVVRSSLPLGAGLGSSASFSVCLAAALLQIGGHIDGSSGFHSEATLNTINSWSFVGESCIHGQPSGIDNVVATRGGAVHFLRTPTVPQVTPYGEFPALRLILTDTRVPRMTSELVAHVAQLKKEWPRVFQPLMDGVAQIVTEADTILQQKHDAEYLATRLGQLVLINHGLLVAMGVSHPSLERVREIADEVQLGPTKLTGAGGGGCAITMATADGNINAFRTGLGSPFRVFETSLGGPGVSFANVDHLPDTIASLEKLDWKH